MNDSRVVVATRKSELALCQCRQFLARLTGRFPFLAVEELHVVTTGDRIVDRPLSEVGGKGLFLKEIEEALLDGRARLAVHSLKDVPPEVHTELVIAAIPLREDPRDVWVARSGQGLLELPAGSTVGTSSLRRGVSVLALRPDLSIVPIRGNVGTRIQKCLEGQVDATILARAGLNRLGLQHHITETLEVSQSLPAVGQGALAIQVRRDDEELIRLLSELEDTDTRLCVEAERGVMTAVEGDCKTPVAAYAERQAGELWLRAFLAEEPPGAGLGGVRSVRGELSRTWPADARSAHNLGLELGRELRRKLQA